MTAIAEPLPIISDDPRIQALYEQSRAAGSSHKLAEMLAFQSPPGSLTDREFFSGQGTLADQFKGDEAMLKRLVSTAASNGRRPQASDVYCSGLARFPGDPEAFVPSSGGRNYIRRLSEQRGHACHGAVEVKKREPTEDSKVLKPKPEKGKPEKTK